MFHVLIGAARRLTFARWRQLGGCGLSQYALSEVLPRFRAGRGHSLSAALDRATLGDIASFSPAAGRELARFAHDLLRDESIPTAEVYDDHDRARVLFPGDFAAWFIDQPGAGPRSAYIIVVGDAPTGRVGDDDGHFLGRNRRFGRCSVPVAGVRRRGDELIAYDAAGREWDAWRMFPRDARHHAPRLARVSDHWRSYSSRAIDPPIWRDHLGQRREWVSVLKSGRVHHFSEL